MAVKGMSTSLVLIVAAIVILITALVVVTVFGGGIQNFLNFFNPWSELTVARSTCDTACAQICITHPGEGTPSGWSSTEITYEGTKKKCDEIGAHGFSCVCNKP